ncbi:EpsG family protein [Paenibacillus radicis (ex Xue et al. 2023)]|uniref:EpsG family protein n=1 Tax=Paenibacillus radicis (ex Xue et al. 2023) TaxID=2972489 RepID=A0ABT1YRN9_9BACL|nr:EpsG family protein [Paenibacillus radicis (ex Xue et al. 2023)]MCR8635405.1 EpsG family protein [Paenibacillus radicis (ex Xue et al. 2023)]
MAILWINLVVVYIFSLFSRYLVKHRTIYAGSGIPMFEKPNKIMVAFVIAVLVLVSGLRNNIGDTYTYIDIYKNTTFTWSYIVSKKDMGFGIFQMILKKFTEDPQMLIFICALITNLLIVLVLYKYTRLFELSIYVYITSGMYVVSMNGIRQYLAAAIIFAATKYIMDGNWKKYTLVILFASLFHGTALILIPMYFIVRRKAWTTTTFLILSFAVLFAMGYSQLSGLFFSAIEDTQYAEYSKFSEGGANIIRVFIYIIPIALSYLGREKLRELFPNSDYIVNMTILGAVFMVISTQNWIFARFSIYFGLYNLIIISWIVQLFVRREQKLIYYSILVFYFLYCFYEQVISLGILYRSNFIQL